MHKKINNWDSVATSIRVIDDVSYQFLEMDSVAIKNLVIEPGVNVAIKADYLELCKLKISGTLLIWAPQVEIGNSFVNDYEFSDSGKILWKDLELFVTDNCAVDFQPGGIYYHHMPLDAVFQCVSDNAYEHAPFDTFWIHGRVLEPKDMSEDDWNQINIVRPHCADTLYLMSSDYRGIIEACGPMEADEECSGELWQRIKADRAKYSTLMDGFDPNEEIYEPEEASAIIGRLFPNHVLGDNWQYHWKSALKNARK